MTFRTSVKRSTTELQNTFGSLGHITTYCITNKNKLHSSQPVALLSFEGVGCTLKVDGHYFKMASPDCNVFWSFSCCQSSSLQLPVIIHVARQ